MITAEYLFVALKETEQKLDKLVNAFLDGSIEKETYLAKKDELITTETDLQRRKSDFSRSPRPHTKSFQTIFYALP